MFFFLPLLYPAVSIDYFRIQAIVPVISSGMNLESKEGLRMRFSLLLYGFYLLLRYTSWKHRSFRDALAGRDFSMLITTADGKRGRRYAVTGGALTTDRVKDRDADFALVWKDPATGFRRMSGMSRKALMKAIGDGSLTLRGDAEKVSAFLDVYNRLLKYYRKPGRMTTEHGAG